MSEINECLRGLVVQTEIPAKLTVSESASQVSVSESASEKTQKVTWIPVKIHGVPGNLVRRVRKN